MSVGPSQSAGCYNAWFSQNGLPDLHDTSGYTSYAKRLSRYIADPSTIRVRTLDAYGNAPSLPAIAKMRAEHLATLKRRNATRSDGTHKKPKPAPKLTLVPSAPAPFAEIEPVVEVAPEPAPEVLPVAARSFQLATALEVIDACADVCGISHGELIGSCRKPQFVKARNLAVAVLRARGNSYPNVCRFVRRQDHTTVMHGLRMFFSREMKDPLFQQAWAALAPCVAKACRSVEELDAVTVTRK